VVNLNEIVLIIADEEPREGLAKELGAIGIVAAPSRKSIFYNAYILGAKKGKTEIRLSPGIWGIENAKHFLFNTRQRMIHFKANVIFSSERIIAEETYYKDITIFLALSNKNLREYK
jgi:hypothetical protein